MDNDQFLPMDQTVTSKGVQL